jgi:hypothetical protein
MEIGSSVMVLLLLQQKRQEKKRRGREVTHNLGFFLGPGLPRGLGTPSSVAADLLAPFFRPSTGGAIDGGAGVPSAAGVAALESEALSPLDTPDAAS